MVLNLGDVVGLKGPYKGYTHGIVVEIISTKDLDKDAQESLLGFLLPSSVDLGISKGF